MADNRKQPRQRVEPRRKTKADEVYNLRRRLKRRARAERARGNTALAETLEAQAAGTYAQKPKGTRGPARLSEVRENINAARETLVHYMRSTFLRTQAAERAEARQREIDEWRKAGIRGPREQATGPQVKPSPLEQAGMAGNGPEDGAPADAGEVQQGEQLEAEIKAPKELTKAEEAALFAATRHVWQNAPYSERENIVLAEYGVRSLEELYKKLVSSFEADEEAQEQTEEERYQYTVSMATITIR